VGIGVDVGVYDEVTVAVRIGVDVGGTRVAFGSGAGVAVGGTDVAVAGGNGVAVFTISATSFTRLTLSVGATLSVLVEQPTTRSINPAMKIYFRYFMFASYEVTFS
jgi:hypothetical protein